MSVTIICNQFRNMACNRDADKWSKKIKYVRQLQEKYCFDHFTKELFYDLLQWGLCITYSVERAKVVTDILKSEGYEINDLDTTNCMGGDFI
jgi:hypothetical protein